MKTGKNNRIVKLALHNIRSVQNVGSIFRTADAAGVLEIILVGITPTPVDRFGRERNDLNKSALGAQKFVKWSYCDEAQFPNLLEKHRQEGFEIISIEQSKNSVDYKNVKLKNKALLVVGNEVEGLPSDVLDASDIVAEINLSGKKESLNVSVATGIALFRILDL